MADHTLLNIRKRLLDSMIDFMEPDEELYDPDHDCGYSRADVDRCAVIIDAYLKSVVTTSASGETEILRAVRRTVEELNALNDSCDGCLIETDQREDLCALILAAAKNAGLESDDDVTEQWREW